MPLVMARAISIDDIVGTTMVAMVNEAFVRQFSPASNPIEHRCRLGPTYEIVGVVRNALFHTPHDRMISFVFVAMPQVTDRMALECEIELRTHGNAAGGGAGGAAEAEPLR